MKLERPTYAEIDLGAITHNSNEIKRLIRPKTKIMAVVKANGYGHGAVSVASAARRGGINYFGVASVAEAMELRRGGISSSILILSEQTKLAVPNIINFHLTQTVYSMDFAKALSDLARKYDKKIPIHIKIDTGMGRVGINYSEAIAFATEISKFKNLRIEGIFTHFANAEKPDDQYTLEQLKRFVDVLAKLEEKKISIPIKHAANSSAAINYPQSHFDMVRIGLSLYGLYPGGVKTEKVDLKPALQFKTKVIFMKKVKAGVPLGYGGTYVTKEDTTIVSIPVGYADGLSRRLSNNGHVLIRGKRFPISGLVSMDLTLVDVGGNTVDIGDEVVLIGKQGAEEISVDEVAYLENTINYEVICSIGKRVPRIYYE